MKSRDEELNDVIKKNGWFDGTMRDWDRTPNREEIAFKATGCLCAFPTWPAPVNCVHVDCMVRRGELPKIAITNRVLRAEYNNYFRFALQSKAGRAHLARLFLEVRRLARATGIYDPWKIPGGWQSIVGSIFV